MTLFLIWLALVTVFLADVLAFMGLTAETKSPGSRWRWMAAPLAFGLIAPVLVGPWRVWAGGTLAAGILIHAGLHLRWMRRLRPAPGSWHELVAGLCRRWGVRRPVAVAEGPGPAAAGLWRRILVLPDESADLPERELEAVVAHELAHLERRDPLRTWTLGIARTLLGWHPLARTTLDRLCLEMELGADRQAAAWFGDTRAYALALGRWGLRESAPGGRPGGPGAPAGQGGWGTGVTSPAPGARSGDLVLRLQVLTDPSRPAPHQALPAWIRVVRLRRRPHAVSRRMPDLWPALLVGYLALFALAAHLL